MIDSQEVFLLLERGTPHPGAGGGMLGLVGGSTPETASVLSLLEVSQRVIVADLTVTDVRIVVTYPIGALLRAPCFRRSNGRIMPAPAAKSFDVAVVGGGPTGFAAAAALAKLGFGVTLVAKTLPEPPAPIAIGTKQQEQRTAALFPCSINALNSLGCDRGLIEGSAPLRAIRLIDMTGGLMRAPEVTFNADEVDLPYLALNLPNADLTFALRQAASKAGVSIEANVEVNSLDLRPEGGVLTLSNSETLSARIVVAADGRASLCRQSAGISCETWAYDQSALVCSFTHDRPHHGISTEIHHSAGPCTTVPLPGNVSSLVWVERPSVVAVLLGLPDSAFNDALADRLGGLLGQVDVITPRRSFPLARLVASTMAKGCIALVGETGHALPPIGAQGLNLGLADVAVLADELAAAKGGTTSDLHSALASYARRRAGDISRRAGAVDMLNRTLEGGSTALHMIRGAGLHVLAAVPAARRAMISQGLAPPTPVPRLMQPGPAY